jgi:phosphoglucosamine mutase
MTLQFGTDGVRGRAEELTGPFVAALGRAAARELRPAGDHAVSRFVIGRDTRESGPAIEAALRAGIEHEGIDVDALGVVPTPAVAHACAAQGVPGAVISASHNPYRDNGIKFFAAGGRKLSDEIETRIEEDLAVLLAGGSAARAAVGAGNAVDGAPAAGDAPLAPAPADSTAAYEASVIPSLAGRRLDGLHVVVDCANGAASGVAPRVLQALGATVDVIHASPDGRNINEACGSTHPRDLQARVVARGAAVGLAFDGDADRVLAVDHTGRVIDGDHLIALCAIDLHERGELVDDTVVVTVMTNLGFRLAMAERGIKVIETAVGDRYVLEALEAGGYALGGEQSGHVIFRRLATTGDGLLTGVQLLDLLARRGAGTGGASLAELADGAMTRLPQVLKNVRVARRRADVADAVAAEIAAVEADLGGQGRVLVRPSGTEPMVRVMIEAPDSQVADRAADRLVAAVTEACGAA